MFQKNLECPRKIYNDPEGSECPKKFQKVPESSRKFVATR